MAEPRDDSRDVPASRPSRLASGSPWAEDDDDDSHALVDPAYERSDRQTLMPRADAPDPGSAPEEQAEGDLLGLRELVGAASETSADGSVDPLDVRLSPELERRLAEAERRAKALRIEAPRPSLDPVDRPSSLVDEAALGWLDEALTSDATGTGANVDTGAERAFAASASERPRAAGAPQKNLDAARPTSPGDDLAERSIAPRLATTANVAKVPSALAPASIETPWVGAPADMIAHAIASRASGSWSFQIDAATRYVVLQDGDVLTAASTHSDESLVAFLVGRGDVETRVGDALAGKIPAFGRLAGAALVAHGQLGQEDLWPSLRAYAEWILARIVADASARGAAAREAPQRLRDEPSVFGGATGAEVFVDAMRRVLPSEAALLRLGGLGARIEKGVRSELLAECALDPSEHAILTQCHGKSVRDVLDASEPGVASLLVGCALLGIIAVAGGARERAERRADPVEDEAIRSRVTARLAVVEDGDYFSVLGIAREATGYEVRRAYLELRRAFEPTRLLTPNTLDLAPSVAIILEVVEEAFHVLRDDHRRERYRRAIEDEPSA